MHQEHTSRRRWWRSVQRTCRKVLDSERDFCCLQWLRCSWLYMYTLKHNPLKAIKWSGNLLNNGPNLEVLNRELKSTDGASTYVRRQGWKTSKLYWLPKLHKNYRFIATSSALLTQCLKHIKTLQSTLHIYRGKRALFWGWFYEGTNKQWPSSNFIGLSGKCICRGFTWVP